MDVGIATAYLVVEYFEEGYTVAYVLTGDKERAQEEVARRNKEYHDWCKAHGLVPRGNAFGLEEAQII